MINNQIQIFSEIKTKSRATTQSNPCFQGTPNKLAQKLLIAPVEHLSKIAIRFDEAVDLYYKMGCQTFLKKGSHAAVITPDGTSFTLVIPHGNEKKLSPRDVKRLKENVLKYYGK